MKALAEDRKVRFLNASDRTICVEFGNEISEEINNRVRAFCIVLEEMQMEGIVELIPTYRSVSVLYRPEVIRYAALRARLEEAVSNTGSIEIPPPSVVHVPVLYGGEEFGPDMKFVAEKNGLSEDEVIAIHSAPEYLIYMLGFTPGYCYLGGMDERIATPRLKTPRVRIPAGSVAIAGLQTGIYSVESPGGWQIIGRTPWKLYDAHREPPIPYEAGQRLKFYPIDQAEYDRIYAEWHAEEGGGEA